MINLRVKKESLTVAMLLLITIGVLVGCTERSSTGKKSAETSDVQSNATLKKLNISAIQNNSNTISINAVVVRENELLSVSLNRIDKNTTLDSGGAFSRPLISKGKNYVAYLKDKALYITTIGSKSIKIADGVPQLSFTWHDKNNLLYSPTTGGLYAYDVANKTTKTYLKNEFNYENITLDGNKRIYAEQYRYYNKDGSDFLDDYGIMFFDPDTKVGKIIIKSIPNKMDTTGDLGMYPVINSMSTDDKYLFIWKHPHSGSLAADGVEFATYDISKKKLIEYTNPVIIALGYKDNISPNPKDSRYVALILGAGREMGRNKELVILDVLTGKFQALSSKGEAAMTPYYSCDGKTILYATSREQKDMNESSSSWLLNGKHYIYSIDTTTKLKKQLTDNPSYFDFAPKYINDKDIVFFRNDKKDNVSLWKIENGKEIMLADGLIFYDDMKYPIDNYFGHFDQELYTDILLGCIIEKHL